MVLSFSPVKKSAFHHEQLAMGAHMVERDGWLQPAFYSNAVDESRQLTESVGLCDASPSGKLLMQGEDLNDLLRRIGQSGNAPAVAEVRHVARPAYGRLARLTADECLLICGPGELPTWGSLLNKVNDDCVHVFDQTSGLAGVRLTGPRSVDLLSKLSEFDTSPDSLPNLACGQAKFAEIHGTIVRTDLGSLPCYDLFFTREFGEYVWDAIFEAGEEFSVAPVGFEATDHLQAQFATDPPMTAT